MGLDSLAACERLEKLVLSGLTRPQFSFLASLAHLWWLELHLGSATDLSAVARATKLKHLELSWTKKLSDLSFVSQLVMLQKLVLDRLTQVTELPDFAALVQLRAVSLSTMKGLTSVDPLARAPALEWLGYGDASNFKPEDFAVALTAPSLRQATVGFGSEKRNREFDALVASKGISTKVGAGDSFTQQPFVYR